MGTLRCVRWRTDRVPGSADSAVTVPMQGFVGAATHYLRGLPMSPKTEMKATYGFWGFAAGAGVAMIVGFNWGGWTTSSTTGKMTQEAVTASQASICVAQFMKDPNHTKKIKEFQAMEIYNRSDLIETGGWDKMPGQDKATYGVSSACAVGIDTALKTDPAKQAKAG
jgi:hypothetical protein